MRIETEESKEDTLPKSIPVSQVSHITLSVFNMIMNNIILISILLSVSLLTNVISYHSVPVNINHLKTRTASASSTSLLFRSPEQRKHNVLVAHQQALKEANAYHTLPLFLSGNNLIESKIVDLQDKVQDEGLGAWLPFASISSLRGLGPQRVTIMNIDFVVWHSPDPSKDGNDKKERKMKKEEKKEPLTWTVQADACTHRLAPLSQGRVDPQSDCIECPYHGWQFDSTGNVTNIPQLDDGVNIEDVRRKPGVNLKTFPTHVVGDLLFVFLPSSLHGEMFPQSLLPEEYYPFLNEYKNRTNLTFFARDLPYSFDFLVENFMDPAHIPFAHHKLQSTRDDGSPIDMEVLVNNFTHVKVSFKDISAKRKRDCFASFQRPSLYFFSERKGALNEKTGDREGDWKPTLTMFLTPISAGKSRVFIPVMNGLKKIKLPYWLMHAATNRFLNSDVWLHDTEREVVRRKEIIPEVSKKLCAMDYQYQSKSDLGVSVFRKWWKEFGMSESPRHTFGMARMDELGPKGMSRREQIDPWENHAKHCSHCREALVKMKRLQLGSLFFALFSAIICRQKILLGTIGATLGLVGHNFFKSLATVIEGNPEASGIPDRSAAASAK